MKRVGFITDYNRPHLTDSDKLTIEPLKKRGIDVESVVWTSPPPSFHQFDALIMRSAWSYHTQLNKFVVWLHSLKTNHIKVFNSIDTMLWNIDKSYLVELSLQGAPIISTTEIHTMTDIPWEEIKNFKEIVVKPMAGSYSTGVTKLKTTDEKNMKQQIATLLKRGSLLIQPFISEIYNGEFSFVFFDKKYSHAVVRIPQNGDFRAIYTYGAISTRIQPNKELIDQAQKIIHSIKEPLLYARLDAIEVNGSLQIMELELTEPHLFFDIVPEAASTFADAIARSI